MTVLRCRSQTTHDLARPRVRDLCKQAIIHCGVLDLASTPRAAGLESGRGGNRPPIVFARVDAEKLEQFNESLGVVMLGFFRALSDRGGYKTTLVAYHSFRPGAGMRLISHWDRAAWLARRDRSRFFEHDKDGKSVLGGECLPSEREANVDMIVQCCMPPMPPPWPISFILPMPPLCRMTHFPTARTVPLSCCMPPMPPPPIDMPTFITRVSVSFAAFF